MNLIRQIVLCKFRIKSAEHK